MLEKRLIGVIGAGRQGQNHIRDIISLGCDVIAADINEAALKQANEKFNCQTTTDYREILNNTNITAVSICAPNSEHYKIAKEALESGKNILIEKPMADTYSDANSLIEISKKAGKSICVGHVFRFNDAIVELKRLVEQKYFGDKIFFIKFVWNNLEPIWNRDIIFDLASHPYDILHFIFNKTPENPSFIGAPCRRESGNEVAFITGNIGKTLVSMDLSWVFPEKIRRIVIVGSEKAATIECVEQTIDIYDFKTKSKTRLWHEANNALRAELAHFINIAYANVPTHSSGEVGAEIVKSLEELREMSKK